MKRKTTIILLFIASALALVYVSLLFTPYFADSNSSTGVVNRIIYGYQVGFGQSGLSDERIIGHWFILVSDLMGIAGAILSLIFAIYFTVSKNKSPFMYFLFALSIPLMAFGLATIFLTWAVYKHLNGTSSSIALYSPSYFISIVCLVIALFINSFLLVILAINRKKEPSHE